MGCPDKKPKKMAFPFGFEPTFHRYRLDEPQKLKKPSRIFVVSMGDLFGDWVPGTDYYVSLDAKKGEIKVKIRLCQNECDNGKLTCLDCTYHETGDSSIGLNEGCTHPILYDEAGEIIPETESLIIECLSNPKHCILLTKKE